MELRERKAIKNPDLTLDRSKCENSARYYDADLGRFVSQDPLGFGAGDANLYRYVGNQAISQTDPSGLDPEFSLVPFEGKTFEFWIDAKGYREGDFAEANNHANRLVSTFPGHERLGTWHHKKLNPKTGKMLMQLVDSGEHLSKGHDGGMKEFFDWAAKEIAKGDGSRLSPVREQAIASAMLSGKSRVELERRLGPLGIRVVKDKCGNWIAAKGGKKLVMATAGTLGRSVATASVKFVGKRLVAIISVTGALAAAKGSFANDGDVASAVCAAAREYQDAETIELIFVSGAETIAEHTIDLEAFTKKRSGALAGADQDALVEHMRQFTESLQPGREVMKEEYRKSLERGFWNHAFDAAKEFWGKFDLLD